MRKTHKQKIIMAGVPDAVFYFLGAAAISFVVGEEREPLLGLWTWPVIFLVVCALYLFLRLLPSLKAHQDHLDWRGAEYEKELEQELKTKGYKRLLRQDWFVKHLATKEKEDPPSIKKFLK